MSALFLSFVLVILIWAHSKALAKENNVMTMTSTCGEENDVFESISISIGAVIDQSSRVGKERKIAMEMALDDIVHASPCFKLHLHFQDSNVNSARKASNVIQLLNNNSAQAILGALTLQEAALVWEFEESSKHIPMISLLPFVNSTAMPQPRYSFISMSYNTEVQMQCIASIVGHFGWRKVIAIYEHSNDFSGDSSLLTHLSDSLRPVGSVLEHHFAFPRFKSMSDHEKYIEQQLINLRSKTITVFSILQCSLEFAMALFKKAKEVGMMDKGYVWIISDDVASLLETIDSSFIVKYMQGVIGIKEKFVDTDDSFKSFKRRFSRKYRTEYPEDEDIHSNPSIHALKAYDATMATSRAIENAERKAESNDLIKYIVANKFHGLSGNICFKNGSLMQKPVFEIVNLIGKSYREIGIWTPRFGFLEEFNDEHVGTKMSIGNDVRLGSIYWPGGEPNVPRGWILSGLDKPLRIGVPAKGAFKQFVNVTYDPYTNQTTITGFSIEVFEAAVRRLPYHLPYELVPFYGSYDEMVAQVHNKTLNAAVGDTTIIVDRYKLADFTQPYMDSALVMVVKVKPDIKKTGLLVLEAFKLDMWIVMASMSLLTGVCIWVNEYVHNSPEFSGPFSKQIGAMLWFCVTVLSFTQREPIRHNLSRLVLSTWLFVTLIVTASFTAAVTTIMTVPKLQASNVDIDYLLHTRATVGCNGRSFVVRYLIDVLQFKPENIKKVSSIDDYPKDFQTGAIKAAFFVVPHARIFLAKNCKGYTITGPSFRLGGFGFVFEKGGQISYDISEAILQLTQSGTLNQLEKRMLSFSECSSSKGADDGPGLGIEPFFILFLVSGGLLGITFLNAIRRVAENHCPILGYIEASLISRGTYRWISILLLPLCTKFRTRIFRQAVTYGYGHGPTNQFNVNELGFPDYYEHNLGVVTSM